MDNYQEQVILPSFRDLLNLTRKSYIIISRTRSNKILSYFVYLDKHDSIFMSKYPYSISYDELIKSRIIELIIKEYYINIPSRDNIIYKIKICILHPKYISRLDLRLFVNYTYYLKNYDPFGYAVMKEIHKLLYPVY